MITPLNKILRYAGLFIFFIGSIFMFSACGSSDDSAKNTLMNSDDGKTTFSFTTDENGFPVNYKVYFDDGEISAIYRNRIRIPQNQINKYKEMIYEEMDDCYNNKYEQETDNNIDINIDLSSLNKNLEKMARELDNKKIHIEFDEEQFNRNMQKLEKELEKLKDIDIKINFDPETFKENMKELEKNLKNLEINENDFPFDRKEFDKCMKELTENMKDEQLTMNNDFRINMDHLKIKMNNLKTNMKHIKSQLRAMDSFIKEMKQELVKDEIIKSENEDIEVEFSSDGLEINNVRVPDHLFEKYKSMYKEHFGSGIEDDLPLEFHE